MNQDEQLNKIDIFVLILFILLIGSYFGAYYADYNWNKDLIKFAKDDSRFRFNDDVNKFYTIQEHIIYFENESTGIKTVAIKNNSDLKYDNINTNYTYIDKYE